MRGRFCNNKSLNCLAKHINPLLPCQPACTIWPGAKICEIAFPGAKICSRRPCNSLGSTQFLNILHLGPLFATTSSLALRSSGSAASLRDSQQFPRIANLIVRVFNRGFLRFSYSQSVAIYQRQSVIRFQIPIWRPRFQE